MTPTRIQRVKSQQVKFFHVCRRCRFAHHCSYFWLFWGRPPRAASQSTCQGHLAARSPTPPGLRTVRPRTASAPAAPSRLVIPPPSPPFPLTHSRPPHTRSPTPTKLRARTPHPLPPPPVVSNRHHQHPLPHPHPHLHPHPNTRARAQGCLVWQWEQDAGCWMSPFRPNVPTTGCPARPSPGLWVGAATVPHPPTPPPPPPPPPWSPSQWTKKGAYDAVMCETTPFWWKPLNKMMLLESICSGP